MKRKLYQKSKQKGLPLWLGTFGDLMSLLLTFFILLLSMATFDKEKVDLAVGSLQGALSVLENGKETEITQPNKIQATPLKTDSPQNEVMNAFSSLAAEYNEVKRIANSPGVDLEESQDGFLMRIPDDILFESGSYEVNNPNGKVFLQRLAMELDSYKDILNLKIVGNTDDVPYAPSSAIDNWDLSNKRALSVAEILLSFGVPASLLQIGGDSYFNPVAPNQTPQDRAKNRRVDIHFSFVGTVKDKKDQAKNIIENLNKQN